MKMVNEISAGGVLVRQGTEGREAVLVSVRGGKRWALPKGRQDEGETLSRTALREVAEETGLLGSIIAPLGSMTFDFTFRDGPDSESRHKIVHFFLMECIGGDISSFDEVEISECRWFPVEEAASLLRFPDEREILLKAEAIFRGLETAEVSTKNTDN